MRIEEVGTRYPDAIVGVKRRGRWVTRSAEFEHLSSGFKSHLRRYNADPESCDMVICWKDDWAQKPRGLEIVALETEMRKIL